ncbi:GEVED domain-containing protein [Shewanella abyssi]|uniref:GEVED domain-containing protein n=1 Tax=Shewanella abyssi TaxID=311789 RepID=UPI00200E4F14|nr:GEVED domain-containing protein [Shewanella abyssi]MCL1049867.1 GEVED domain-containing protein [Shewanella abyssi]
MSSSTTILMAGLVSNLALATCDISPDNRYEYIDSISIDGIEVTDGTEINSGDVVQLTPGYASYRYGEYWSVWLDLNADGDFDDTNELLIRTTSKSTEAVLATIIFADDVSIENTQLRVLVHPDPATDDSCGYDGYGDVNDYSVSINRGEDDGNGNNDYALVTQPGGGSNEHIANIELAGVSFSSGDGSGYEDYSSTKTFDIVDGDSVQLTPVTNWNTDWAIWIDGDSNGAFDNDEQVFSGSGQRDAIVSGTLDLSEIATGKKRMRIAMSGGGSATANGFRFGEIEDYSVNVQRDEDDDKLYGSHVQWEHDSVTVKIFRFEFTDVDLTWSVSRLESEMEEIVDYFDKESYGRFDVNYQIYSDVIQVGEKVSVWDNKSANDWKAYYAEKLISLGEADYWTIDDNTIYLILAPEISDWNEEREEWVPYGIKAGVNPGAIRVYDTGDERSQAGGIAHEMGHAMGLHHAQGLDGQDTVFGVGDYEKEMIGYGNAFSLMGNNAWDFGGLNLYYKNFFQSWKIEDEVPLISHSGTYRIYAFDQGSVKGDLGIRLAAGNSDVTYWVEYRTKDDANTQGVLINTEGYFPDEDARSYYYGTSFLLDMTPNTKPDDLNDEFDDFEDFLDGSLLIGKSYTDKWGAFTITPKATGGTLGTAGAWIEVEVEMH